jgi:hypothetical protein
MPARRIFSCKPWIDLLDFEFTRNGKRATYASLSVEKDSWCDTPVKYSRPEKPA